MISLCGRLLFKYTGLKVIGIPRAIIGYRYLCLSNASLLLLGLE
jgi:hypothetical protein